MFQNRYAVSIHGRSDALSRKGAEAHWFGETPLTMRSGGPVSERSARLLSAAHVRRFQPLFDANGCHTGFL